MICYEFPWTYITVDFETGFATIWDKNENLEIWEADSLEEAIQFLTEEIQ